MTASSAWCELKAALSASIPAERLIDDPLRTLAYGTDGLCATQCPVGINTGDLGAPPER